MKLTSQLTNFDVLNELSGNDTKFLKEMLTTYLEQLPKDLNLIITAHENKNWKKTGDIAHSMKSSAKFMGVDEMHKDLSEVENLCRDQSQLNKVENLVSNVYEMGMTVIMELKQKLREIG